MNNVSKIKFCRLCDSKKLSLVVNFGLVPLGNNLLKNKKQSQYANVYKLQLFKCYDCNHFQLGHQINENLLFVKNYTYLTGIAPSFKVHFKNYCDWITDFCKLPKKATVVDIGSNDGTCLNYFNLKNYLVCGVDPAIEPATIANKNGIFTINSFFNDKTVLFIKKKFKKVDFVTSHNVLAHVKDLANTFRNIFNLLKIDGYFCFEVGYFLNVLKNNFFDTIYHEHLDYHHAQPLVEHLTKIGFSIVMIKTNNIQGGSLRILCRKDKKNKIYYQALNFLNNEKKTILYNKNFLNNWPVLIQKKISRFSKLVNNKISRGNIIAGYGAPTKAILLLKLAKLNSKHIKFIVEDNKLKVGRFLPKKNIPIKNFNYLINNPPDIIVILAWNFTNDIIKNLKKTTNRKIKVIVPLPELRVFNI